MKGIVCSGKTGRALMFVLGNRAEGGEREWAAAFVAAGAPRRALVRERNIERWVGGSEG